MTDQQLEQLHAQTLALLGHPDWDSFVTTAKTVALKSYRHHCNFAAASPDGKWIAIVGDEPNLILLHADDD